MLVPSVAFGGDPFEIEVYASDINAPLETSLELHSNYTLAGNKEPAYQGADAPDHAMRMTLESAFGITEYLEFGAYLQSMLNGDGEYRFAGGKVRTKWMIPRRYTGASFLGINIELSLVPRRIERSRWANELRPILGYSDGRWLIAVNPIISYAIASPNRWRLAFDPCAKGGFNTQAGFMIGTEYYSGQGYFSDMPLKLSAQEHLVFATFDLVEPSKDDRTIRPAALPPRPVNASSYDNEWEFNLGVGRSLTDATPQHWIIKTILGRSF
jgi:hypothetical protein